MTVAVPSGNPETSGSLTGHILAQGWADTPTPKSNAKVFLMLLAGLGILVAAGLIMVLATGDTLSKLFGGLLGG
jgi:hypothetical protein